MSAWETERRKHRRSFTTEMRPNISVSPIFSIPFCVCRYLPHTISTYMCSSCMYGCNEQQTVRCNLLADNTNNGQNRPTNAYALARCSTMFMCAWNVCSVHQYTICDSALMQRCNDALMHRYTDAVGCRFLSVWSMRKRYEYDYECMHIAHCTLKEIG